MNKAKKIYNFYLDGFRGMTIGKSLWLLILIKLAIIFLVLKLFFFPNIVKEESKRTGLEESQVVHDKLMNR